MDSNTEFAAMNFQNFSPEEKKTNHVIFLGILIIIVSGVAIYYYIKSDKNKSTITTLSSQLASLKSEIDLEKVKKEKEEKLNNS